VMLILAALAGLGAPLFSSFISEFMVLLSGITYSGYLWVAVLVPGITAAYMLWMLWRAVLSERKADVEYHDITRGQVLYLALFLIPLIILIVAPSLLLSPVSQFTKVLGGG
jgi:NADH:ubiquinone oxidoreductase subunit 4 (subunit M)